MGYPLLRKPPPPKKTLGAELVLPKKLQMPHPLEAIFEDALAQATRGKGQERHGQGREFLAQPWLAIAKAHGPGFLTGQAEKKLRESAGRDYAQRRSERLGSIVYIAMSIIFDDMQNAAQED